MLNSFREAMDAARDRNNPAAQTLLLGWVIENMPEAFKRYMATEHYARCKALLEAEITDPFAAEVIARQACVVLLTAVDPPRAAQRLADVPGYVDQEGRAIPQVYAKLKPNYPPEVVAEAISQEGQGNASNPREGIL